MDENPEIAKALIGRTGTLKGKNTEGNDSAWTFVIRSVYIKESSSEWTGTPTYSNGNSETKKRLDSGAVLLIELDNGQLFEVAPDDSRLRLDAETPPPKRREPLPKAEEKSLRIVGDDGNQ